MVIVVQGVALAKSFSKSSPPQSFIPSNEFLTLEYNDDPADDQQVSGQEIEEDDKELQGVYKCLSWIVDSSIRSKVQSYAVIIQDAHATKDSTTTPYIAYNIPKKLKNLLLDQPGGDGDPLPFPVERSSNWNDEPGEHIITAEILGLNKKLKFNQPAAVVSSANDAEAEVGGEQVREEGNVTVTKSMLESHARDHVIARDTLTLKYTRAS